MFSTFCKNKQTKKTKRDECIIYNQVNVDERVCHMNALDNINNINFNNSTWI